MRLTPAIGKMTPEQILRKKPFSVPIPAAASGPMPILSPGSVYVNPLDNVARELRTQADFVREFYPSSHKINNIKYYPNTLYFNRESGAYQAKVRSRIAVGFQQYIHLQRKEALLGNNVGMRLVGDATSRDMIDRLAFFRSGSASSAFFGILSAVSGFVIGAYIPVSQFSGGVRTVCNLFPASHITILLRNVLLGGVLGHIDNGIGGLDQGEFVQVLKDVFTFKADMFGSSLNTTAMTSFVLAILTLSLIVMVWTYSKNYKKK